MSASRHPPRGLSHEEQAAWARLAQSVTPLDGRKHPGIGEHEALHTDNQAKSSAKALGKKQPAPMPKAAHVTPRPRATVLPPPAKRHFNSQLDGHWNRKLKSGQVAPDYTLDLHDHSLDAAYTRVMSGMDQARAMGARVILVIAGRERPVDPADRGHRRGAIRAKLLDWLAASHHGDAIAAVRRAHIRHGGEGAVYLVLKRGV